MKYVIYYVVGLLILSAAPALIMGLIFTAGINYLLYNIFKGLTSGNAEGGSGDSGSHEPDPGDGWDGTGNPFV